MGLEIRIVRSGILMEARGLDDVFQHAAHVAVDISDRELAIFHSLNDLLNLCGLSGFHEVVAGMHLSDGLQTLTDAYPVGHHDPFIAPVVAQNLREQVVVAHRVLPVYLIVGGHDSPGVALTDGYLKATEVEFTGGTLRYSFVNRRTVCLLRVHGKVLGRDTGSLTLHTIDISSSDFTCQQGIFGIILEVTSAEGIAMEVHAWAEDDVAAVFLGLITDSLTDFPDKFCVPSGGQTAADGKGCGIIGLVGSLSSGVDTYAGRAVGEDCGWDSETWNGR